MAKKLYEEASVRSIANAIRAKNGSTATYKIAEMAGAVQALTGAEDVQWHQCPEAVRNYLAGVTYDPADYTVSQIASYAPAEAVAANTKPIGQTVGGTTYYNQEPNTKTPFASGNKAGTLKPLDRLRWIKSAYASNVRDLGGWPCDGGTVRYGLLFRGGEVTASDRAVLVQECGARHELNLRGQTEANRTASPLGSDIWFTCPENYVWYSLANKAAWKEILDCVITAVTHNEPVYFHCSAGADRTGTVACILEAILGLSQSDIDKDYELTCFSTGTDTDANARRRNETDWKNLIEAINGHSGASFRDKAVNFATSCGIPISRINAFRAAMSTGAPEVLTGGTHTVTNTLTHVSTNNTATQVEDQGSYTATLTADEDYTIQTVTVTMGGADISSCYANGVVSIPSVTGDVVITAVATATVYADIELYSPNGVALNKKYSGTSIVDGNGYYLTTMVPVNMAKYRYIKVNGAHMSGYPGAVNASNPTLYKIAFMKNGAIYAVQYTDTLALSSDKNAMQWNMDMSKYTHYQQCDAVQLSVLVSMSAITSADVPTADKLKVTCTTAL
nr:MAG TPA: tyrosine phosphatase family protein [Caudoviricetes sp.]